MDWTPRSVIRWLFDSDRGASGRLIPRWIFLRGLGLIYFSAFFSLIFQIRGLIGPNGILPAAQYLQAVANQLGSARFWFAPTLIVDLERLSHADGALLGGTVRVPGSDIEFVAAFHTCGLLRVFSFFRQRRQ